MAERRALGVVLAGGRGLRLSGRKGMAMLAGRPLLDYPVRAMLAADLDVAVVAKRESRLQVPSGVTRLDEPDEPHHPLVGILHAVDALAGAVVVCAGDMPFVTPDLLRWLAAAEGSDAVVLSVGGRLQPLLGRYGPTQAEAMREAIVQERSMGWFVGQLGAACRVMSDEELSGFGNPRRLTMDIDTPEQLAEAERYLDGTDVAPSSKL